MGLPVISVIFKKLSNTIIKRSQRGIVALVIRDTKANVKEYKSFDEINSDDYNSDNLDLIEKCFMGNPYKVIVVAALAATSIGDVLSQLDLKKFNYVAVPCMDESESTVIKTYVNNARSKKKFIKAVLANVAADSESIINYTTEGNVIGDKTYTAIQYTARIAGILAGMPLNRSATYFVLPELTAITEKSDPDSNIDDGELILINDGEKIKIGRAVNSLTTLTTDKTSEYQKIKIIEGMDILREDIKKVFEDYYVGKYVNSYDNKCIFFNDITTYLNDIALEGVLDVNGQNTAFLNLASQIKYLKDNGVDVEPMDEQQIKEANTGSNVFGQSSVRFMDAMEDLTFNMDM